jgi:hypothetical protein
LRRGREEGEEKEQFFSFSPPPPAFNFFFFSHKHSVDKGDDFRSHPKRRGIQIRDPIYRKRNLGRRNSETPSRVSFFSRAEERERGMKEIRRTNEEAKDKRGGMKENEGGLRRMKEDEEIEEED